MGCDLSKIKQKSQASALPAKRVLFLGLDNAGKTSILLQFKEQMFLDQTAVPTIGLNIETI